VTLPDQPPFGEACTRLWVVCDEVDGGVLGGERADPLVGE
jgi:hypothetical protein